MLLEVGLTILLGVLVCYIVVLHTEIEGLEGQTEQRLHEWVKKFVDMKVYADFVEQERDRLRGIVQMYREGKIVPDDIDRLRERDRILTEIEKMETEYKDVDYWLPFIQMVSSCKTRVLEDEARRRCETPDKNCVTLPNGSCAGKGCMHDAIEMPHRDALPDSFFERDDGE